MTPDVDDFVVTTNAIAVEAYRARMRAVARREAAALNVRRWLERVAVLMQALVFVAFLTFALFLAFHKAVTP